MLLDNPELTLNMNSPLEKALQNGLNTHLLKRSLKMVTHQAPTCRHPNTYGILSIAQIRHSSQNVTEERCPTLGTNCCTGVFSRTIDSLVHALGAYSSMTEPTITQLYMHLLSKLTFLIFRRWSYSLPHVLYPVSSIPIWFTP